MHLLLSETNSFTEGQAYDIQQTSGDIVILSHAATELNALASAMQKFVKQAKQQNQPLACPSLRLMNLGFLGHPATIDAYLEQTIKGAQIVIVRLLGGKNYWQYGCEHLRDFCHINQIRLVFLAGDQNFDAELAALSLLDKTISQQIFEFFCASGVDNFYGLLIFLADYLGYAHYKTQLIKPTALALCGVLSDNQTSKTQGGVCIFCYRALLDSGDTAPITALVEAFARQNIRASAYYVYNFRDAEITQSVQEYLQATRPDVIIFATGFALGKMGDLELPAMLQGLDNVPLLQILLSSTPMRDWQDGDRLAMGLAMRDVAMNVALPELDGRIFTRAIAFKGESYIDPLTECPLSNYQLVADRIDFVTQLAGNMIRLRHLPASEKKLGFVLGNYPASDGRLANGVGLNTPEAVLWLLKQASDAGIMCNHIPADSDILMARLQAGPTNQNPKRAVSEAQLSLQHYQQYFASLPDILQQAVSDRWGEPQQDAFYQNDAFHLPVMILGNIAIGLQPSRGYDVDPDEACHDPALVPPHAYWAFYFWFRKEFAIDCLVHIGKHGTLEWLPGKSLALSNTCYPDAVLGATPVIYPFICNDPGEGTQAKRRSQAVILDHLPPPIAMGGLYDELAELEGLMDEYYDARHLDSKRRDRLADEMIKMAEAMQLEINLPDSQADMQTKLSAIETFLCDIKFTMIRAGLHQYGQAPDNVPIFLLGLLRFQRGDRPHQQSLLQSIAQESGLDFDVLASEEMVGVANCPAMLQDYLFADNPSLQAQYHRSLLAEAVHDYAESLIIGTAQLPQDSAQKMPITHAIITQELPAIRDLVTQSIQLESASFIKAINGQFIAPGPSGAPSRGRPDILPTGRNFYSVDMRTIPSQAAWHIGQESAELLLETHLQTHGTDLRQAVLSMWGTAEMRTGGDNVAQAMALMGVQPQRQQTRIIGYQIIPASMLNRPRVDVTFRISGLFRDAFPNVIQQLAEMVHAVAQLDETPQQNPLAENYRKNYHSYCQQGMDTELAELYASQRIFGSAPGTYGAGLQHLIANGNWQSDADFAQIFMEWGGYAYNGGALAGQNLPELLQERLSHAEAIIHNQDNREHDLLDSDDYYQFEGGLAASVRYYSGKQPEIYHNDHANPAQPKISTLKQEIARIIHARAANPKWIKAITQHGYKGAFEIAATVEYLFAFAATAKVVESHQFDRLFEAYVADENIRDFMAQHNPQALADMLARFDEAVSRNLWQPHRNSTQKLLQELLAK